MKIQMRRGVQAKLPNLDVAEIGFTTDTERIFIGNGSGNTEIAKISDLIPGQAGPKGDSGPQGPPGVAGTLARSVIWDTDWWTDVDDVVAARILCWAERMNMIDILCVGISACAPTSVPSLDAFFCAEGRRGMTIGIDFAATDYGGTPPYHQNMLQSLHDYQSNADAEEIVRMYRRALSLSQSKVDIIGVGYPQAITNLLKSPPDDISPLTGAQLVTQKVGKLWLMAGGYPTGLENNFYRNARSRTAGNYLCANWPTPITFLGYEIGNTVITGNTLATVSPAADDMLTKALADHGSASGRASWDPMLTLLAAYGDVNMAGYATVKGTNAVDASTGANTFTLDSNGQHAYVVKIQTDYWFKNTINSIIEKKSWGARKVGANQLPRPGLPADNVPLVITPSLPGGTYNGAKSISFTSNKGAAVYYTTDGTAPTTLSTRYKASFTLSTNTTLKYFGIDAAGNSSAVQTSAYTINPFDGALDLVARWVASDLSATADGTTIGAWSDKSANGNTLNSPSSGENPTFYTSKSGKAAVKFNGTAKLQTGNVAMPTNMTVYMKVMWDTLPTSNQTIMSQDTGGFPNRLWHETVDATSFKSIGFSNTTGVTDQQTGTLVVNNWHTFVAKHTPSTIEAFFDNVSNGSISIAPNTGTQKINVGGAYSGSNWVEGMTGYVTEIRIYAVAHDNLDITTVISQMS